MESKIVNLIKGKGRMGVTGEGGKEVRGRRDDGQRLQSITYTRWRISGDPLCSLVNNTGLNTWKLLRG